MVGEQERQKAIPLIPGSGLSVAPTEITDGKQAIDIMFWASELFPAAAMTGTPFIFKASTTDERPAGTPQPAKIFP